MMAKMDFSRAALFLAAAMLSSSVLHGTVLAFAPSHNAVFSASSFGISTHHVNTPASSSSLHMAGFGGGASQKKKKKKSGPDPIMTKLKPKHQWDRFLALKDSSIILVAVRVLGSEEWLEVGKVRSEGDAFTDIAVAVHRAIIAEHAKRVHPLKVMPSDLVEWAYQGDDKKTWVAVSKDVVQGAPDGIEKKIGFEGKPDPFSGYYCSYDGGKLVTKVNPTVE